MSKFKIGDVVKIKTSEIKMTVNEVHPEEGVECVWFDLRNILQTKIFKEDALVLVNE